MLSRPCARPRRRPRAAHARRRARAARRCSRPGVRLAVVGAGSGRPRGRGDRPRARRRGHVVEAAAAPLAAVLGRRASAPGCSNCTRAAGVEILAGARLVDAVHGAGRVSALALAGGAASRATPCSWPSAMAPATGWLTSSGRPAAAARTAVRGARRRRCRPHRAAARLRRRRRAPAGATGRPPPARAPPSRATILGRPRARAPARRASGATSTACACSSSARPPAMTACGPRRPRRGRRARALPPRRAAVGGLLVGRPRDLPALRRLLQHTDTRPERNAA